MCGIIDNQRYETYEDKANPLAKEERKQERLSTKMLRKCWRNGHMYGSDSETCEKLVNPDAR
jgi:hypothetical protein